MRHYKVKKFAVESKKANVPDQLLTKTLNDFLSMMEQGQQRCALGARLYKLRIASKSGRGKSGGSRSILAFNQGEWVIWLHFFSKNEKGNITKNEFKKLKMLSDILFELDKQEIDRLIEIGELYEVKNYV